MTELRTVKEGIALGESPRWHDGRLWLADWGAREVIAVNLDGESEVVARMPSMPFSLDWLPDGHLVIVSARDGQVLRRQADGSLVGYTDLSRLADKPWNDIVADGRGNIYIGNLGFDFPAGQFAPGTIVLVTPDGRARPVADGMAFPNGMAVTPDNSTLIVAESYAAALTAFDIAADGGLSNRRVWARLCEGAAPDGICLDTDGAVWYADVPNKRCVRVREGGTVLDTVELELGCFACALGGPDHQTLLIVANQWPLPTDGSRTGRVISARAPAPGAGWP
jgi:sugar lactone lactonase YvrE